MKKQRIYALAILLSSVMIGLVINQSLILKNGITQSQKLFEDQMNDVLGEVSEDLKLFDYVPYIDNVINIDDNNSDSIRRDSLVLTNLQAIFEYGIFLKDERAIHAFELSGDSTQIDLETMDLMDALKSMSTRRIAINKDLLEVLSTKTKDIKRKPPPVTENVIRNILDNRLSERSIYISYDLESQIKRYGGMRPSSLVKDKDESVFERLVFKNELTGEYHGKISVTVTNRNQYIWYENLLFIITSVALILLISAGFVFSVVVILRQRKLSDLKTAFINNMTHELKTPVATIGIASQMLNDDKVLEVPSKVIQYSEIIKEENLRLGNHIEKVLQVAQLEQGSIKLNMKKVEMHDILAKLKASYMLRIEAAEGSLQENLQADCCSIWGDEQHLYNVLSNIYDNAIKYSREDLSIVVSTRNNENLFELTIYDNGIGMSSSVQRHIFDTFYRESSGNVHNVKGFGLGLSYVKGMVERHKGRISVRSEEGQFSEFKLIFPLNKD